MVLGMALTVEMVTIDCADPHALAEFSDHDGPRLGSLRLSEPRVLADHRGTVFCVGGPE
jgi:hypothetical protein